MSSASSSESEVLDTKTRSVLKIMFLTLFLDLVGFSIIFPLFPSMLEYYLGQRGGSGLLASLVAALERFTESVSAPSDIAVIVLFGGVLSSLYSMLQFLFAPILGSLSDRYGRRPVLLVSVTGILVSYALWFFAGSFALLILARTLGGIMSGNVSTASAVVADVTSARNRSKGMAVVGVAFGLGFILGPAIGGFSAALNLTERWPELARLGVNPFSFPALVALALSAVNLAFVYARFPETRPGSTAKNRVTRSINPLILFRTDAYPGVT
ncbi:MAG: MFS transporter, partial [Candidatus Hydrogenedentes bacterium]|nr:MFS transporter [Candidatus Hydrogenedentota bacterium]